MKMNLIELKIVFTVPNPDWVEMLKLSGPGFYTGFLQLHVFSYRIFFLRLPKPSIYFKVHLIEYAARIFSYLLCCNRESNSHQFSCTSLRDLNSGCFTEGATALDFSFSCCSQASLTPARVVIEQINCNNYDVYFISCRQTLACTCLEKLVLEEHLVAFRFLFSPSRSCIDHLQARIYKDLTYMYKFVWNTNLVKHFCFVLQRKFTNIPQLATYVCNYQIILTIKLPNRLSTFFPDV